MEDISKPQEKKAYSNPLFVIFFLLLFYPIGLYLMWLKTNWPTWVKSAITLLIVIIGISILMHISDATPTKSQTVAAAPTASPIPTVTESPVKKAEEDAYVASKSAVIQQFSTDDDIMEAEFQNEKVSTVKLIEDAKIAYALYDKLNYCLSCSPPPDKYLSYNLFFGEAFTTATEAIHAYYLALQKHDDYDANIARSLYTVQAGYVKYPIKPGDYAWEISISKTANETLTKMGFDL